jgi:hypothetical protein
LVAKPPTSAVRSQPFCRFVFDPAPRLDFGDEAQNPRELFIGKRYAQKRVRSDSQCGGFKPYAFQAFRDSRHQATMRSIADREKLKKASALRFGAGRGRSTAMCSSKNCKIGEERLEFAFRNRSGRLAEEKNDVRRTPEAGLMFSPAPRRATTNRSARVNAA